MLAKKPIVLDGQPLLRFVSNYQPWQPGANIAKPHKAFRDSIAVAADFQSQMSAVVSFGQGLLRTQPAAASIDLLQ